MSSSDHLDKKFLEIFAQILIALKSFEGKYHKKFNLSELARYLRLTKQDADYMAGYLIEFQDEFKEFGRIFKKHELQKKYENGNIYIKTEKLFNLVPEIIHLKKEHGNWLSDLIYTFQHVKKGKGFDLSKKDGDMVKKILLLMKKYPYFFNKNGSEIVYPSQLGSELGNTILSCKKLNKQVENIKIHDLEIWVE